MTIKGQLEQKKEQKCFKLGNYDVLVVPINQKKIFLRVLDLSLKIQFAEQELTFDKIGVSTFITALQASRKEISIVPAMIKNEGDQLLELKIKIESPFLKTIEESIFIKKFRNLDDLQIIEMKLKSMSQKMEKIKLKGCDQISRIYNFEPEQKLYNQQGYEILSSIRLKKGKYLITFSFNLKANNQWLYLYLNQGESIITNSGFYVPCTNQFMPFTVRIIKRIQEDEKEISFTTGTASSYPVTLSNKIITALKLFD